MAAGWRPGVSMEGGGGWRGWRGLGYGGEWQCWWWWVPVGGDGWLVGVAERLVGPEGGGVGVTSGRFSELGKVSELLGVVEEFELEVGLLGG